MASRIESRLYAFAAGVSAMLLAVILRDHGTDALTAWNALGAAGAVALFAKSLETD